MVNLNGKVLPVTQAPLDISNRGFAFGDAVFETLKVVNQKIFFWEAHYFRLMASMRIMRMEIPMDFSPEFLENEILQLIKANNLEESPVRIRLSVFRKEGGLYTPETNNIGYCMTACALESPFYLINSEDYIVDLFKDHYVNSGLLSTIKTNNRAINILGSIFAKENGYQNCLLLNEKKNVVEALNGNIFLANGKTLKTPPLSDGCLKGIIRGKLIEIIPQIEGFQILEESISPFELQKADEMFITNSIVGMQPVSKYRKKEYGTKILKQVLPKLNMKARLA